MSLKDKAAMVDLSKIGTSIGNRGQGSKTAIGLHADALFRDEKVTTENIELKRQLEEFAGASATRQIDPNKIIPSKWANRHEQSFSNDEFQQLKEEIASSNGNIQPIKVRPLAGRVGQYELVFGHRRHRACKELDIPVLAVIEEMGDADLFCQMDRENRERSPLRPYEAGMTYAKALDEGLFPSARKLAESASIDLSLLGKALTLARLPSDVIKAFPSPLDLQYRWASEITLAMQKDPDLVLSRAKDILNQSPRPSASQVLALLTKGGGTVPPPATKKLVIKGKGGQSGTIAFDSGKRTAVISLAKMDPSKFDEIEKTIKALIS